MDPHAARKVAAVRGRCRLVHHRRAHHPFAPAQVLAAVALLSATLLAPAAPSFASVCDGAPITVQFARADVAFVGTPTAWHYPKADADFISTADPIHYAFTV